MIEGIDEHANKFKIEPLQVMVKFIPILSIERYSAKMIEKEIIRIKSFLVSQIRRGITKKEEQNLLRGIADFYKAEPGTNHRIKATSYLLKLNFLE